MSEQDILRSYYEARQEDARLSSQAGAVEYLVTTSYIDRYLRPGYRMLEVGAGTGRYALHYASQGYDVDAVELVEHNLKILRQGIQPGWRVNPVLGNALDLSMYPDHAFDMTLVLGPMYHLFTEEDKLTCLREAMRVTRKDGLLFVAYCQFDASMIQACFARNMYTFLVDNGLLDPKTYLPIDNPAGVFTLYRKQQIDVLNERVGLTRLHYIGTDMFTQYFADKVNEMPQDLYQKYLEYTLTICENEQLVGASNHVLDVLRNSK